MSLGVLRFPKNVPDQVRAEVKQYLACKKSVGMLQYQITQVTHINHARDLRDRKRQAEDYIKSFEDKYNVTGEDSQKNK